MALEIERKWLIDMEKAPFDLRRMESHHIVQSYVSFRPQIRLRAIDGKQFVLTVKGTPKSQASALTREEFEFTLTRESYEHLMTKIEGNTIVKTRYLVPEELACETGGTRTFEVDVFEGHFEGLVVAEMEFGSVKEAEAFPMPAWATADISADPLYRNVVMAQQP